LILVLVDDINLSCYFILILIFRVTEYVIDKKYMS
jgi:hypothetical protein